MNIVMDTHVHTIASGHHTTDTLRDIVFAAKNKGLICTAVTDHAPKMLGAASESYFMNLKFCDKIKYGIRVLYGAELNVFNTAGEVDLSFEILKTLDFAIASLHKDIFRPQSKENNTQALMNAMKNPYVSIIGHPADSAFPLDYNLLTDKAKETGTVLELNSVDVSPCGYRESDKTGLKFMLELCKKKGVYVSLGSDSHGREHVGDFDESLKLLESLNFPEELVANTDVNKFMKIINAKR